jgi:cold shock CspA family protein
VELCVVKGEAGSGKSVFVRRLAWEAATNFECLCLYHRRTGSLRFSAIQELYSLSGKRLFLFVDRAAYHVEELECILGNAKSSKTPLTIVTAERHNEWNVRCERLERYVTYEDDITRLNRTEIAELVTKLREAYALGQLSAKSDAECRGIFEQKLDRQILVALHEATKGKTFEEIVIDEYNRIIPIEAQLLYLDICAFQRLGADLRAGLISRIGGVSFEEFRERLLRPLEKVVFVGKDNYGKDYLYRARHQKIAEIVFDNALSSQKAKYDILLRLLKGMNRGYSEDNEAFQSLMHRSTLRTIFANADLARQLLDEGLVLTGNDDFVLHQRAVFELQHSEGDPNIALDFINKALAKSYGDKAKLHTKANVFRRLALLSDNDIKKGHLRNDAIAVLNQIGHKSSRDYILSLNIQIDELVDLLKAPAQGDLSERAISAKVLQIEHLLQAEHRYREALHQDAKAFGAIKKAHVANPSIVPIAIRLSRVYTDRGEVENAIATLRETLSSNSDRDLRFELGKVLSDDPIHSLSSWETIELFERAFESDDDRLMPRLYLMREYWRFRDADKFRNLQRAVRNIPAPRHLRSEPNLIIRIAGEPQLFTGEIRRKEADYALISPKDGYPEVFIHRSKVSGPNFEDLKFGSTLAFHVDFSMKGATGVVE